MSFKVNNKINIIGVTFIILLSALNATSAWAKTITVGIIETATDPSETVAGFKAGMADQGYVEGKDIKYIYCSVTDTGEQITDSKIRELLSHNIDLLLSVTNGPALRAKKMSEGTGIPVVAAACIKMAQIGLVNNLKHPEGNVTGVQIADTASKALEWLHMVIAKARNIYIQYNPDDTVSTLYLPELKGAASQLGLKLIPDEVHTAEEAVTAIKKLPADIDAVLRIPMSSFFLEKDKLDQAVIERGLPSISIGPSDDAVAVFGSDRFEMGRQAGRMAHLILSGVRPSEIPVETSEVYLTINLKTAKKIGLDIPADILVRAKKIIR